MSPTLQDAVFPGSEPESKFDPKLIESIRRLGVNGNMPALSGIDPDQYAKAMKLATARGITPAAASKLLEGASPEQLRQMDGSAFGPGRPLYTLSATAQAWLLANPDNGALAQDDAAAIADLTAALDRLKPDRSMFGDFGAAVGEGFDTLEASYWHMAVAAKRVSPEAGARGAAAANARARASRAGASKTMRQYRVLLENARGWDVIPAALSSPTGFIGMQLENLAFRVPALVAGAAGGVAGSALIPVPVLGTAIGVAGGQFVGGVAGEMGSWMEQQFADARFDTASEADLLRAYSDPALMSRIAGEGLRKGIGTSGLDALEALIGLRGFGGAARTTGKAATMGARIARKGAQATVKGVLEGAGEALGQFAAVGEVDPKDVQLEALLSAGTTPVELVTTEMLNAMNQRRAARGAAAGARSATDADAVKEAGKVWPGSKLVQRLPEKARDFVQAQLVGQDQELFAARFDVDEWDERWTAAGKDPQQELERVMPAGGAAEYWAAKGANGRGTITIPLGNFIEGYQGTSDYDELTDLARWRPDGPNLREREIFGQELLSDAQTEVSRTTKLYQREADLAAQIAKIDEQLRSMPVDVPRGTSALGAAPSGMAGTTTGQPSAASSPSGASQISPPRTAGTAAEESSRGPGTRGPSTAPQPGAEPVPSAGASAAIVGRTPRDTEGSIVGRGEAAVSGTTSTAPSRATLIAERTQLKAELDDLVVKREEDESRAEAFRARIEQEAIAAGQPKELAKHNATTLAAGFSAMARRSGIPVAEAENRWKIFIGRGFAKPDEMQQQQPRKLMQRGEDILKIAKERTLDAEAEVNRLRNKLEDVAELEIPAATGQLHPHRADAILREAQNDFAIKKAELQALDIELQRARKDLKSGIPVPKGTIEVIADDIEDAKTRLNISKRMLDEAQRQVESFKRSAEFEAVRAELDKAREALATANVLETKTKAAIRAQELEATAAAEDFDRLMLPAQEWKSIFSVSQRDLLLEKYMQTEDVVEAIEEIALDEAVNEIEDDVEVAVEKEINDIIGESEEDIDRIVNERIQEIFDEFIDAEIEDQLDEMQRRGEIPDANLENIHEGDEGPMGVRVSWPNGRETFYAFDDWQAAEDHAKDLNESFRNADDAQDTARERANDDILEERVDEDNIRSDVENEFRDDIDEDAIRARIRNQLIDDFDLTDIINERIGPEYAEKVTDEQLLAFLREDEGMQKEMEKLIPSKVDVPFHAEQIKSAIGNVGRFDPRNPNILLQTEKAVTEFTDPDEHGRRLIRLGFLEHADESSMIHEIGHIFMVMMRDLASSEQAPQQVKDDWAAIQEFLGVEPGAQMTEAQHEQWARSWEAFHREGNAPSNKLKSAFAAFRAFLRRIYASLLDLERQSPGRIKLNDTIRGVMARMLATDEEIAEAAYEFGHTALPAQALMEMTDAERDRYIRKAQDDQDEATARADADVNREIADLQAALRSEKMQKLRMEVRAEVDASPAVLLVQKMRDGTVERFDEATIVELYGPDSVRTNGLREMGLLAPTDGLDPELIAEANGADSADQLVDAVLATQDIDGIVERTARQRLKADFPELMGARGVRELRRQAIANKSRADRLEEEHKFLARKAAGLEKKLDKSKAETKELKGAMDREAAERRKQFGSVPTTADVRWRASRDLQGKTYQEIRPSEYLSASRRESTLANDRSRVGDWEGAALAKGRERLAFETYRQAVKLRAEGERNAKRGRYLGTTGAQAKLGKAGHTWQEQMNALLERYSFKKLGPGKVKEIQSLRGWLARIEGEGLPKPDVPEWILEQTQQQHWTELTPQQLDDLRYTMDQIWHIAMTKNKLLTSARKRTIGSARDEVKEEIEESKLPRDVDPGERDSWWRRIWASSRPIDSIARQIGGDRNGAIWQHGVRPVVEAANEETGQAVDANKVLIDGRNKYLTNEDRREWTRYRKIEGVRERMSLQRRFMVAVNWGNAEGRDRLLMRFTEDEVKIILDTLEQRHADFARVVWELEDSFWPKSREIWRKLKGVVPPKVEAIPFETKGGSVTWRGGYHHLYYEKHQRVEDMDLNAQSLRITRGDTIRATTRSGSMNERQDVVNGRLKVRLDFGTVTSHLAEVIHMNTHILPLRDVQAVMLDDDVQQMLTDRYGESIAAQFGSSYKHIGAGTWASNDSFARGLGYLRAGTIIMRIGVKVTMNLINMGGIFQSMAAIGTTPVARSIGYLMREPTKLLEIHAQIKAADPHMRYRDRTFQREVAEQSNRFMTMSRTSDVKAAIGHMSFLMMAVSQAIVDVPTWIAAFETAGGDFSALREGNPDFAKTYKEAIAQAGQMVTATQSGGRHVDMAEVMRGPEAQKIFTTFLGYANRTMNIAAEKTAKLKRNPKTVANSIAWARDMMLLFMAPAIWTLIVNELMRGDEDEGDDEEIPERLARQVGSNILGMFVGLRELSALPLGIDRYTGPAGAGAFSEFYNLGVQIGQIEDEDDWDEALFVAAMKAAGVALHLPTTQAIESYKGLSQYLEGEAPPSAILLGPPRDR